jgi:hypothetical protein
MAVVKRSVAASKAWRGGDRSLNIGARTVDRALDIKSLR